MISDTLFVNIYWFGAFSRCSQFYSQQVPTSEDVSPFAVPCWLVTASSLLEAGGEVPGMRLESKWSNALVLFSNSRHNLVTGSVSCSSSEGCNLSLWCSSQHAASDSNVPWRIVPGKWSMRTFLTLVWTSARDFSVVYVSSLSSGRSTTLTLFKRDYYILLKCRFWMGVVSFLGQGHQIPVGIPWKNKFSFYRDTWSYIKCPSWTIYDISSFKHPSK